MKYKYKYDQWLAMNLQNGSPPTKNTNNNVQMI